MITHKKSLLYYAGIATFFASSHAAQEAQLVTFHYSVESVVKLAQDYDNLYAADMLPQDRFKKLLAIFHADNKTAQTCAAATLLCHLNKDKQFAGLNKKDLNHKQIDSALKHLDYYVQVLSNLAPNIDLDEHVHVNYCPIARKFCSLQPRLCTIPALEHVKKHGEAIKTHKNAHSIHKQHAESLLQKAAGLQKNINNSAVTNKLIEMLTYATHALFGQTYRPGHHAE